MRYHKLLRNLRWMALRPFFVKNKNIAYKRMAASVLIASLVIMGIQPVMAYAAGTETTSASSDHITIGSSNQSYRKYLSGIENQTMTGESIEISGVSYTSGEYINIVDLPDNLGQALMTEENSTVTWQFTIPVSGMYGFKVDYYPLEGHGSEIQRSVQIDGETIVAELESISFPRIFKDEKPIERVEAGDDIRYAQVEIKESLTASIADSNGFYGDALYFYFDAGVHTISFTGIQEPMAVEKITVFSEEDSYLSYADYLKETNAKEVSGRLQDGIRIYEAEDMYRKSDSGIYGTSDISSPENSPYDYSSQKLNVIGGDKWCSVGQWVSYEIEVPETGYYNIGFRYRQQNARQAVRRLTIDGEVPFKEAGNIVFAKDDSWQVSLAGGDDPYSFYLTEGKHEIRLEVVMGDIRDSLIDGKEILDQLNQINWSLMTVLGTEPDTNRDYQLDTYMPDIMPKLSACAEDLREIVASWIEISDQRDSAVAQVEQLAELLEELAKKPSKIPSKYSYFRDSISSYATLIEDEKRQPILLDYIFVSEKGTELPKADSNLFVKIKYGILRFFASFLHDDSSLSGQESGEASAEESITVWIGNGLSGGRDQALVLDRLIKQNFTPDSGIHVKVQLVPAGTILTATLAGKGPDVALQLTGSDPVNYAMRNAVIPLSDFDDWQEVADRFAPETFEGFTYRDKVYAVPETMDFPVLFYRKDIMQSLGIDVHDLKSWDDMIEALPTIQSNNMNFAIPASYTSFYMFLFQNGGSLYNARGTKSMLGEKESLDAFYTYMKFYKSYGLPFSYSLETRIRSGEMPIAVANYSVYNVISISGPEIAGLWSMAPVPGTRRDDGTIDASVPVTCAGCSIMSKAKDPEKCWEFVKWWTSAETQYQFGRELESTLGSGARYNTANIEAISMLPWTAEERAVILDQMDTLAGVPEIPGGYMTSRNVDFALKAVYSKNSDARDTLRSYINAIDEEIALKREEFNLD